MSLAGIRCTTPVHGVRHACLETPAFATTASQGGCTPPIREGSEARNREVSEARGISEARGASEACGACDAQPVKQELLVVVLARLAPGALRRP